MAEQGESTQECLIIAERDMISDLPDAILSHILGKLPTKYAIGTSVLSTRWKHLFAQIPYPDISIDNSDLLNPNRDSDLKNYEFLYNRRKDNFIKFMYNLLNVTLHNAPRIRKIHLKFHFDQWFSDDDDDLFTEHVSKWVDTALNLNVSYLWIFCAHSYLETPDSLCRCELVEIMLDWQAEFCVPSSVYVCLPNLKRLYLKHVIFDDDDLRKVLSGCPVLEELCLCYCEFRNQEYTDDPLGVRVFSPSVKKLKWFQCFSDDIYGIELDMPTLNFFWYDDFLPHYFLVKNLNSLCKAQIVVRPTSLQREGSTHEDRVLYMENMANIVVGCSKVEFLSLTNHSIEAFSCSFTSLYPYYNLIELELDEIDANGWKHLPCLLKNAPNLEVLVFAKGFRVYKGCYEIFLSHIGQCPTQLVSKLQRIRFEYFDGEVEAVKLMIFFLKNAKMLKKIEIKLAVLYGDRLVKAASIVEVMQILSEKCQIERIFGEQKNNSDRSFGMGKFE